MKIETLRLGALATKVLGPKFRPNHNKIEIDITYKCNLRCLNCNRSCRLAPSDESMSLGQIQKFIKESVGQKRMWEWINLCGGEPTLHKQLFEILKALLDYKNKVSKHTRIRFFTNGFGPEVNKILQKLPDGIELVNTMKKDRSGENVYSPHISFNLAPVDLVEYKYADYTNGCLITELCGIGLNMFGYYQCAIAGAIDRVFGYDIGRKKMPARDDLMPEEMRRLCRFCGHFKPYRKVTEEKISPVWRAAYEKYRENKPSLSLY